MSARRLVSSDGTQEKSCLARVWRVVQRCVDLSVARQAWMCRVFSFDRQPLGTDARDSHLVELGIPHVSFRFRCL